MNKTAGGFNNSKLNEYVPIEEAYKTINELKNVSRTMANTRVGSQMTTNGQILSQLKHRLQSQSELKNYQ
jgi:hypothetical protein